MMNVGAMYDWKRNIPATFYCKPAALSQTILKDAKQLAETGCVTSRPQSDKLSNFGWQEQPVDVLSFGTTHSSDITREISETVASQKVSFGKF